MFFPALNSAPDKVELLQQNWGEGAGIQADSSNRRDGVGAWRKAGGTGVEQGGNWRRAKPTPFHHLGEANSRRHREHCGHQTGSG